MRASVKIEGGAAMNLIEIQKSSGLSLPSRKYPFVDPFCIRNFFARATLPFRDSAYTN
jgi:hypothetical protein